MLHLDAGDLDPTTDPPSPPGDLKAELDQFTTVDACVRQRARLDPLVADALEAIGYDTFLRDACRVLEAVAARDPRRCETIDASVLRERCEATFAEVIGDPDVCPWQFSTRRERGRDAACVAIASRDPRLCAAVETRPMAATCEAIATRDAAPCNQLSSREQTRCMRDAQRWRSAIPATPAAAPPLPPSAGKVHVAGADRDAAVESDIEADVARGVVLLQQRNGTRLVIGSLSAAGPGFIAPPPHVRATLALELLVAPRPGLSPREKAGTSSGVDHPAARATDVPSATPGLVQPQPEIPPGQARIERIELLLPGQMPFAMPALGSMLIAKIDKLEAVRGGEVRLSISGVMEGEGGSRHVQADITTFVRDIVKAVALYEVKIPSLGTDGGMR